MKKLKHNEAYIIIGSNNQFYPPYIKDLKDIKIEIKEITRDRTRAELPETLYVYRATEIERIDL